MAQNGTAGPCVLYPEAEVYVQSLGATEDFSDIGSLHWLEKHANLEKLNMQAAYEAINDVDESVKELLIVEQKLASVVEEAISVETWRHTVYHPHVQQAEADQEEISSSTVAYMVLYHELTAVTLLETVCFHEDSVSEMGDSVSDLIDYCCRSVRDLLTKPGPRKDHTSGEGRTGQTELNNLIRMETKLRMDCGLKCLSIIRGVSNCLDSLPAGVANAFLTSNDVPLLLTEVLTTAPWYREASQSQTGEVYINGTWKPVQDSVEVLSCEAQAWIALVQTLMGSKAALRYELTSFRVNQLRKLESIMPDTLLDQIPALKALKKMFVQSCFTQDPRLAMTSTQKTPQCLVLEVGAGLQDKWRAKAEGCLLHTFQHVFNPDASFISAFAQLMADIYDLDKLEALCDSPPVCAQCGQLASKRCSSCRGEWYCRRQCQVEHWAKHKQVCEVLRQ